MDRPRRIRLVVAFGTGLVLLLLAFFGAPLVAILFLPDLGADDADENGAMMAAFFQAADIANTVSMISLGFAGLAFLYVLIELGAWFIGPRESPTTNAE